MDAAWFEPKYRCSQPGRLIYFNRKMRLKNSLDVEFLIINRPILAKA